MAGKPPRPPVAAQPPVESRGLGGAPGGQPAQRRLLAPQLQARQRRAGSAAAGQQQQQPSQQGQPHRQHQHLQRAPAAGAGPRAGAPAADGAAGPAAVGLGEAAGGAVQGPTAGVAIKLEGSAWGSEGRGNEGAGDEMHAARRKPRGVIDEGGGSFLMQLTVPEDGKKWRIRFPTEVSRGRGRGLCRRAGLNAVGARAQRGAPLTRRSALSRAADTRPASCCWLFQVWK